MKIYCAHSTGFDYKAEFYAPLLQIGGHEFIFPHAENAATNSKDVIANCDLVLAEVSYPSTGMGIELGWANAVDIPILAIHAADKSISTSIPLIARTILAYSSREDLVHQLYVYLDA